MAKEREPVIQVKNLYKIYRVGENKVRALNGVNLKIYRGEFCSIVGTSGSGKSTMLNMLAGLEKPTKGEIIVGGEHLEKMNENQLVRFRREHVGFIFQSFNLLGTMNAKENVALPLTFRRVPKKVRLEKADQMLELVGLPKHKTHRPNEMSGGQQQRRSGDYLCGRADGKPGFQYFSGGDGADEADCAGAEPDPCNGNPRQPSGQLCRPDFSYY